jgi:hypothetical protein
MSCIESQAKTPPHWNISATTPTMSTTGTNLIEVDRPLKT